MILNGAFCKPNALGTTDMSKTRTPYHFGETHEDPVRIFPILREWAWHRCTSVPFISGKEFRARGCGSRVFVLGAGRAGFAGEGQAVGQSSCFQGVL